MRLISFVFFLFFSVICGFCEIPPDAGPVQLLDFSPNDNKTVTITKDSVERLFLNPLVSDRDVVVVSIAGAFRKGKSFLLNYMLRYMYANYKSTSNFNKAFNETEAENWLGSPDEPLKGFSWKSSTKRETTGIIFWSDIFLYDAPNGEKIAIYLVDTQGLFDHSSSPTDNIRIFSLSALISSVQIMNIYSMIEESHLEYLQFATEIARFTAVETDSTSKPFQKLMFLIRDWISPEEYNYGLQGGNDFIKSFLKIKDFHTNELKTVREYLQKTFESISCFLMPYPGRATARNSSFDGHWSDIDEEFVDTMKELFPAILSPANLTVKTINGVPIKAFELSVYVRQYVDLFKSENLPEAKSIYESTLDNQFQILMSKAVEIYLESISLYQEHIKDTPEVYQLHNVSKALALRYFDEEKKFGNKEDATVYETELDEKLEKAFNEWKPVTMEFLEKIRAEQGKADAQKNLASEAGKRDEKAKAQAELADKKYIELQKQIAQARYDSVESRREAELVRKKLVKAERERAEALQKEQETRKYFEEMQKQSEFYEQQLNLERQKASERVKERVVYVRQRDGIGQWFGKVGAGILGFFKFVGNAVKKVFVGDRGW